MRDWNEMSDMEQALCLYSDAHKDAHGFRPRGAHSFATAEEVHAAIDRLAGIMEENAKAEALQAADALMRFNNELAIIETTAGAGDRATAFRWWLDARNVQPDEYCTLAYLAEHELWEAGIAFRDMPAIINLLK